MEEEEEHYVRVRNNKMEEGRGKWTRSGRRRRRGLSSAAKRHLADNRRDYVEHKHTAQRLTKIYVAKQLASRDTCFA